MKPRGGRRPGAGRKPGQRDPRITAVEARALLAALVPQAVMPADYARTLDCPVDAVRAALRAGCTVRCATGWRRAIAAAGPTQAAMTVGELRTHLETLSPDLPVALLVGTDGVGIDLARPAGVVVALGVQRRPFSGGMVLPGNDVLVFVASSSADHIALRRTE